MVSNWHWETLPSGKLHQHSLKTPNDVSELDPRVSAGLPHALQSPCHFSTRDCGGWRWCNWSHWIKSSCLLPVGPALIVDPAERQKHPVRPQHVNFTNPCLECAHTGTHTHTHSSAVHRHSGLRQAKQESTRLDAVHGDLTFSSVFWEKQTNLGCKLDKH